MTHHESLYWKDKDGEYHYLGCPKILGADDLVTIVSDDIYENLNKIHEMSVSCEISFVNSSMLHIRLMQIIHPNNWLRMHGYPMKRRK